MSLVFALVTASDPAVEAAVRAFTGAADRRDIAAIEAATHPDFRSLVTRAGAPGVTVLPRAVYTQLARDGKVGGTERALAIHGVNVRGDLAWASVTLTGPVARFESVMTLARVEHGWVVLEDATLFSAL